jgi:hypothetical protein
MEEWFRIKCIGLNEIYIFIIYLLTIDDGPVWIKFEVIWIYVL